ncbi:MAG: hypothetical protein CHACPFDD_00824 [Phycisphaerae bacterium]|nr:hypothetical protein [Phycisphaerae bacterium]
MTRAKRATALSFLLLPPTVLSPHLGCASPQPARADIPRLVETERTRIERFFDAPFTHPFETRVFNVRHDLESFAAAKWHMPELPCWAVAMGSGSTLVILDPTAWAEEACEHDARDAEHVRGIVAHELVHVFHGQHNADSEFEHSDELGWFIEGLAVYASGQLTPQREQQARQAAASGFPPRLTDAWSGPARYAVAGTLARQVDRRLGRAGMLAALGDRSTAELLARLNTSESELLENWRQALK